MQFSKSLLQKHGPHFLLIGQEHSFLPVLDIWNIIVDYLFLQHFLRIQVYVVMIVSAAVWLERSSNQPRLLAQALENDEIIFYGEVRFHNLEGIIWIEYCHLADHELRNSLPFNIISSEFFLAIDGHIIDALLLNNIVWYFYLVILLQLKPIIVVIKPKGQTP